MIHFHFKDEIFYVKDEHFSISILMIILFMLTPVLLVMVVNKKEQYKELSEEKKECIFEINRLLIYYTYVIVVCLLIRFSYMNSEISVNGFLYDKDVKLDCSGEPFDCCEIYDKCYNDNNQIKSDTYVYNIKKGGQCHTVSEMISLDYIEEDCSNSEFGCCYIRGTCDSYIRQNYSYNTYSSIDGKGFPHGYLNTGKTKTDKEGSNCDNIDNLILNHVNKNTESIFSTLMMIIIAFVLFNICLMNRNLVIQKFNLVIHKFNCEKNDEKNDEKNGLTLEPDEDFNDSSDESSDVQIDYP